MKIGISISPLFFFALLAGGASASESATSGRYRLPADAFPPATSAFADPTDWWTCVIERPLYYYIGWAADKEVAAQEAVKACADDGITCTVDEAVCNPSG